MLGWERVLRMLDSLLKAGQSLGNVLRIVVVWVDSSVALISMVDASDSRRIS